jgi:hypothetical protein
MHSHKKRRKTLEKNRRSFRQKLMKKGKLTMPSEDVDTRETVPETHKKIIGSLKPQEGDVVVIGSADTCDSAEYGAIAAAWTLLGDGAQ